MKKIPPFLIIIGFLLVPVVLFGLTFVNGVDYDWRTALETTGMIYGGAIIVLLVVIMNRNRR